jgi:hypothetical protein
MADHDLPPPTHADDVPRGGPWVICIAISIALVLAVAFAPQRWKLPLAAISILTLLVGVGMLILSRGGERGS